MRSVEFLVIGAGPGGLCAAYTLARAGREVLVLERNEEIGPKTCAGGLSMKAVALLQPMGLPELLGRTSFPRASLLGEKPWYLDPELGVVRTVARRDLGRWQAQITRAAGAAIDTGSPVTAIDRHEHSVTVGRGEKIHYRHLIGADGSHSLVRKALGLPCPRRLFAVEYNIPALEMDEMIVRMDSLALKSGYFWIFPHDEYTSIGCGADRKLVSPRHLRRYLDECLDESGLTCGGAPLEGFPIECEFAGVEFGDTHLVGDAAGLASPITGEGIYAALISGQEVARRLLDPGYHCPELHRWLRVRAVHTALATLWRARWPRELSYRGIRSLSTDPRGRRTITALFMG